MTGYAVSAAFKTEAGWVALLASKKGVKRLVLPQPTAAQAWKSLGVKIPKNHSILEDTIRRLQDYFSGRKTTFTEILDLSGTTPFQRRVWEITRQIPYGETRSYHWVAFQMGNEAAARAVGQALGRNPIPIIIPCHRVLASDGSLGGYRGGLEMKRFLLELERGKR
jgi:methylated-DNA-[protein]-cysteine S-methyltransferase